AIAYLTRNFRNVEALEMISMLQKIEKGKRRSLELEIRYLTTMVAAGMWRKSLPICRQTLLTALRSREKKQINAARFILGRVLMRLGEYDESLKEIAQARAYFLKAKDYKKLISSYRITGLIEYYLLNFPAARQAMKNALAIIPQLSRKRRKTERSALCVNNGLILLKEGKISRAMAQYKKALEISRSALAIDAESIALGNIGTIHYTRGNMSLAEEHFEKALELALQVGDQKNISVMSLNLGGVYFHQKDYDKALKTYERTRDSALEIGNVRILMKAIGNIGTMYAMKNDYLKAIETYKKKLILVKKLEDPEGLCYTLGNIAEAYHRLGRKEEAEMTFVKAIENAEKFSLEFNAMYHMSAYAQYLIMNGRLPEAADLVKRAYSISWKYERNEDAFMTRMTYGLYLYRSEGNSGIEIFKSLKADATEVEKNNLDQFLKDFEITLDDD
ncbi:tetratricopeptide repeat protein, partial [bacterium]|nr:tetratricopeptide repeat protein [bacterium]